MKTGTVEIDTSRTIPPPSDRASDQSRASVDRSAVLTAEPVASNRKVALRALVVAVNADDWGLATWRRTLDRVGAQYDVILTQNQDLTTSTLVGGDGVGRYNAILLTNTMQVDTGGGSFVSQLTDTEWNTLWAYERDFGVRQAALYTSYGMWPEDYCLRGGSEGGVTGGEVLRVGLTTDGSARFPYLAPAARIPLQESYVYRNSLEAGCDAQPLLTADGAVLGVRSVSVDGRDRMALTFTSNEHLLQSDLLVFGMLRWATRRLHFGEQRHWLNVDVDDWFNSSDIRHPDGTIESDPGYQMSGHDAYNADQAQTALRNKYPLASQFRLNLAFNGGDADLSARAQCHPNGGIDTLTATTRCLRARFNWINHTLTHPKMNFTDYVTNVNEILQNRDVASKLGLSTPKDVLKTGEYSGLGVYHPDPDNDIDPPTDYGLGASNPALLQAAQDTGVKYLHGNMSFPSHQPSCFNCAIVHPMKPAVSIVPDWPTNLAYFASTPEEETSFYNWFFGPGGIFEYWSEPQSYEQVIQHESDLALLHLTSGSLYSHTLHISNLRDYGGGRTLTFDWLDAMVGKYSSYYAVPLLTPQWPALASYAAQRTRHFGTLDQVRGVYDPATNKIRVTSSKTAAEVTLNGVGTGTSGSSTYGTDTSAVLKVNSAKPVTVTANRLS